MKKHNPFFIRFCEVRNFKKIPNTNVWVTTIDEPSCNGSYDSVKVADTSLIRLFHRIKHDFY